LHFIDRIGTYATPAGSGAVVQMLALGEQLLVLYAGGLLAVWHVGVYDKPEVCYNNGSVMESSTFSNSSEVLHIAQ
jgi:hypothetical protein